MTTLDELDLPAQCRVCAHAITAVAATFRTMGRPSLSDHCVELATWFADLAHDLEQLLEDR